MERRVAAIVATLALVAAACGGEDGAAAPTTAPSTTTPVVADLDTATFEETFTDTGRDRTLRTVVHHPTAGGPYPLVVFSHGLTARPEVYTEVTSALARRGYVVAAPEFPNTSAGAADPRGNLFDVNDQPGDVSFVVDEVLRLSGEPDSALGGLVDPERIGAVGHSLGAITTLLATFHGCCVDERIDAAVAYAGAALFGRDGGRYFDGVGTPLLMIHGDDDGLVVLPLGRMAFERAGPPKFFVTLLGAEHTPPYVGSPPWFEVVEATTLAFLDHYVAGDRGGLERLRAVAEVEGVSTLEAVTGAAGVSGVSRPPGGRGS